MLEGDCLTIGFSPENAFFKESLESIENVALVERVFSERLGIELIVHYAIINGAVAPIPEKDSAVVKDVLKAFGGEIVNRWHNE